MELSSESAAEKAPRWMVGPTEDVVQAFMEALVDPLLPLEITSMPPSENVQRAVAIKMHAVVLLYNYHHRKQKPELVFLEFVTFCKLAIAIRPPLIAFMKMMKETKLDELNSAEDRLSITEKAIRDACDIALGLDAARDVPNIEGWPISKVAVLLIDSKKENCMLQFNTTEGAWSLFEKELNEPSSITPEILVMKEAGNKRKQDNLKISTSTTEFSQLRYDTIKDVTGTGIYTSELEVLGTHLTISLSKEKSAVCFYIMRCSGSLNEHEQVPLKFLLESVQGPLAEKVADGSWKATPAVKYHHILPYVELILNCLPGLADDRRNCPEIFYGDGVGCGKNILSSPPRVLTTIRANELSDICIDSEDNKTPSPKLRVYHHRRKKNISMKNAEQLREAVPDLKMEVDSLKSNQTQKSVEKVSGDKGCIANTCYQIDFPATGNQLAQMVEFRHDLGAQNMSVSGQMQVEAAKFKHNLGEQTTSASDQVQKALSLLYSKRQELYSQKCNVEDALALCEDNISRIRDGGDVDLARQCIKSIICGKLDSLLENEAQVQDGNNCKSRHEKQTRLSEAYLPGMSSCQDLEYTCMRNEWRLPRYLTESSDGKFIANVVVEGKEFRLHARGGFGSNPRAARETAAAEMIALRS